eukprot:m.90977 g.90977  ORF g.90977 m.90977 type:complete len:224 (-) comp8858_c2_seq3:966-1637(-)
MPAFNKDSETSDLSPTPMCGYGWDTRPRYSSRVLTGNWVESRSSQPLIGGVRTSQEAWMTESRSAFSPHRDVRNRDQMNQSLLWKATMDAPSKNRLMTSSSSTTSSTSSSLNASFSTLPSLNESSPNRGKIMYPHGTRSYCRHTGKWVPEPVDVKVTALGRSEFTRTSRSMRNSSEDEDFRPFSTTCKSTFKNHSLPSINRPQHGRTTCSLTRTQFRPSITRN